MINSNKTTNQWSNSSRMEVKGYSCRTISTTGPWPIITQRFLRRDGSVNNGVWECITCSSLICNLTQRTRCGVQKIGNCGRLQKFF